MKSPDAYVSGLFLCTRVDRSSKHILRCLVWLVSIFARRLIHPSKAGFYSFYLRLLLSK